MKVELAQLAGRDNDTAYNLERTLAAIAACAVDTQLIMFPEGHLMGFPSPRPWPRWPRRWRVPPSVR